MNTCRDSLNEMDKFLDISKLLKLDKKEMENLYTPIAADWISNQNLKTMKKAGPDGFTGEFYQTFK